MGSSGTGTTSHLYMELVKRVAGIDITHVPYRGGGPAIQDLLAGNIDMMFDVMPALMPHVREGRFRALAVGSAERITYCPRPGGRAGDERAAARQGRRCPGLVRDHGAGRHAGAGAGTAACADHPGRQGAGIRRAADPARLPAARRTPRPRRSGPSGAARRRAGRRWWRSAAPRRSRIRNSAQACRSPPRRYSLPSSTGGKP